jgi:hypothetical protein
LGIEKDVPRADQLLVQLCMSEKTIAREVRDLRDGAARAGFLVRHNLQSLIRSP